MNADDELQVNQKIFRSRVYQPEVLSISSSDRVGSDAEENVLGFYNSFRVMLKTPVLNVSSLQLLRATLPNIVPSLPDSELVFWYYRLPVQSPYSEPVPPDPQYLHCVRILPSTYPRERIPEAFPINRVYLKYQDLLNDLNKAVAADDTSNPYFAGVNDVGFSYDATLNKFVFTGNNAFDEEGVLQFFYSYAGYNDPNVIQAQKILQAATTGSFGILGLSGQPYVAGHTLNLRLGFVWTGATITDVSYRNHIRPVPEYLKNALSLVHTGTSYTAETYADLVYSHNCHIYCNLTSGSAYGSQGEPNLLMCVPMDDVPLGVNFYISSLEQRLTKVPREIYEIQVTLKTDTGLPYYMPNSATVILDLGFTFIE